MFQKHKSLIVDLSIGLVLAVSCVSMNWNQGYSISHLLCDGFFVAGLLLLGSGLLIYCGNHGAFDMMGFGVKSVVGMFTRRDETQGEKEDYYSYCQRKAQERKPFGHLLISGGVYLVLSMICMVIYQMTA